MERDKVTGFLLYQGNLLTPSEITTIRREVQDLGRRSQTETLGTLPSVVPVSEGVRRGSGVVYRPHDLDPVKTSSTLKELSLRDPEW